MIGTIFAEQTRTIASVSTGAGAATTGQESGGCDGDKDSSEQQASVDVVSDRGEVDAERRDGTGDVEAGVGGEQETSARAAGTVPE